MTWKGCGQDSKVDFTPTLTGDALAAAELQATLQAKLAADELAALKAQIAELQVTPYSLPTHSSRTPHSLLTLPTHSSLPAHSVLTAHPLLLTPCPLLTPHSHRTRRSLCTPYLFCRRPSSRPRLRAATPTRRSWPTLGGRWPTLRRRWPMPRLRWPTPRPATRTRTRPRRPSACRRCSRDRPSSSTVPLMPL